MGLFDLEVNCLTKILFGALVVVSLVMVALQHFAGRWYLQILRFLLLFSNIVPIRSLAKINVASYSRERERQRGHSFPLFFPL